MRCAPPGEGVGRFWYNGTVCTDAVLFADDASLGSRSRPGRDGRLGIASTAGHAGWTAHAEAHLHTDRCE